MTPAQVRSDITQLQTWLVRREPKYLRNINRYQNNGEQRESISELYNVVSGFNYQTSDPDVGPSPVQNVIKSCIDTKVSKMSQVKVRPFFNPVNGKWQTRKVCRAGQHFFDEFYQKHAVYQLANLSYRDCQIFEVGHIWVNEEDLEPIRIRPWEHFVDPAEAHYGKYSRCMLRFWKYPLWVLKDKIKKGTRASAELERNPHAMASEVHVYYDLEGQKKYWYVGEELIDERAITFVRLPVASIYYNPPVKGLWSTSLVDDLYTIQRQIDLINEKIHDSTELTPANMGIVPTIGGIKKSTIDAGKAGLWYEYEPTPGVSTPATIVTPAPINAQYQALLEYYVQMAYNISGVSQLSAMAKKPSGLNSGVALDTLEDVESERHNFELQNYQKFLMDICEIAVDIGGKGETILPQRAGRSSVTWKDLQREREFYAVQFSPASALSNTPKVKLEQIEKLQKMGIVGPEWAATMLNFPDLEKSYGIASANRDDIEAITERAAEQGDFDFCEVVSLPDLYKNVMNEIMRLDADEESEKIIRNLKEFLILLKDKIDSLAKAAQPPAPVTPEAPPAPPPAAQPVVLGQPATPIPQAPNPLAVVPPPGGQL